jgi:hypothetical protein
VAFNEESLEYFLLPCVRVKFGVWEGLVYVVLLEQGPGRKYAAMEQGAPANGRLRFDMFRGGRG